MDTLKYALRNLLKNPGFSLLAVMALAIGLGACTAMFAAVNSVLLKPLPFHQPDRLVWMENHHRGGGMSGRTSQVFNLLDWREQSQSFSGIAAYHAFFEYLQYTLSGEGEPQRLRGVPVSQNFLDVLGVQPAIGRNFSVDETAWQNGNMPAVILSDKFWRQHFGADRDIIGKVLNIDQRPVNVIGVLPQRFDFDSVFNPGSRVDMLVPFPLVEQTNSQGNTLFAIGRLRPGASLTQAQAELDGINERLQKQHAERGPFGAILSELDTHVRGNYRTAFAVLLGAVGCLLLIVCLNLSNLLLVRAQSRSKELATRLALGASPWQLAKSTLAESFLLASFGLIIGLALAELALRGLGHLQAFNIPLLQSAQLDTTAVAVSLLATLLSAAVCGAYPTLQILRSNANAALNEAGTRGSAGRETSRARNGMVVTQIALACALLIGSSLLIESFRQLLDVELGFQPEKVLALRVDGARNFSDASERLAYYEALLGQVRDLPGVESASLSDTLPLGRNRTWGVASGSEGEQPDIRTAASPRLVDPDYLQTLRIPLLAGRYFDRGDSAESARVVVINQTLAEQLWPGRDPIGQELKQGGSSARPYGRVIGVVADVPRDLEQAPAGDMYLNYRQDQRWSSLELALRSDRPFNELTAAVRATLRDFDPQLASGDVTTLNRIVDQAMAPRMLTTSLLGGFSSLSLLVAALGVYSVIAFSVGQRTREMAIRRALGGQRRDLLALVLREGVRVALIGSLLGLGLAALGSQIMQHMLFGVEALDPGLFALNAILVSGVALLACLFPALRAARADAVAALR